MTEKYMSEKMLKKFRTKTQKDVSKRKEELINLVIVINLQILHR
jgi:hypothetical protein